MLVEHEQERIASWLATPGAYPHPPSRVQEIETHISRVFVLDDLVYKLKKPVHFAFLDFSTPQKREQACREEVRLNRRLAPDVYLGVVPIMRSEPGGYLIGGTGEAVDWLVQMRRLPTGQTVESLHRQGALRPWHIDGLARSLVEFYRSLAPISIQPEEYRARCQSHVQENLLELMAVQHHLPSAIVERVHAFQLQLLELSSNVFLKRVLQGRIIEGHGDLRPEHICLCEPPVIFDCIEFDREFRELDVVDELAFLATECEFLGAGWVGEQLFELYQRQTDDRPPTVLIDFYKSYRACVRAKIAALRAEQLQGDARAAAENEAARHLEWADRYAQPWMRPLVIVVGGLPGTGKSTLARALTQTFGAELLRTDVVRRELFSHDGGSSAADDDLYHVNARMRVYQELFLRAAGFIDQKIPVVLDGTFSAASHVHQAHQLAQDRRTIWLAVECCCSPAIARDRIQRRLDAGGDPSEARPEIHDLHGARWEAWPSEISQVRIDTMGPLAGQMAAVVAHLRECERQPHDGSLGSAR